MKLLPSAPPDVELNYYLSAIKQASSLKALLPLLAPMEACVDRCGEFLEQATGSTPEVIRTIDGMAELYQLSELVRVYVPI
jgi:hypothetical protein